MAWNIAWPSYSMSLKTFVGKWVMLLFLCFIVQSKTHVSTSQQWGRTYNHLEERGSIRRDRWGWAANILTIIQPTTVLESSLAWLNTFSLMFYLDSFFLASRDD